MSASASHQTTKTMTNSPSMQPESSVTGGLRLSAAASLLGVLLLASIGVALLMEQGDAAEATILPTIIVQRVLTVTPIVPLVETGIVSGSLPHRVDGALDAHPAGLPATSATATQAPAASDEIDAKSAPAAEDGLAEVGVPELPQTMIDEPRRSGGGSSNPLGYDVWSPLLDGSLGLRGSTVVNGEVARTPKSHRGLRPFSDADHG